MKWHRFPDVGVYEAENRFFALLGARKRVEIPADLLLAVGPYFLLWGFILIGIEAAREGDWGTITVVAVVAALVVASPVRVALQRARRAG